MMHLRRFALGAMLSGVLLANGTAFAASISKSSNAASSKKPPAVSCTIKGNIGAKKEKIYHLSVGCPNYKQTIIEAAKGERMFCTEKEAIAAGWRKALNCKK